MKISSPEDIELDPFAAGVVWVSTSVTNVSRQATASSRGARVRGARPRASGRGRVSRYLTFATAQWNNERSNGRWVEPPDVTLKLGA